VFYDAILHVGTLAGVFAIYRRDITRIVKSIFYRNRKNEGNYPQGRTMLWFIILGTIPTGIIGLVFHSFFEYSFYDPFSITIGFIVTKVLILIISLLKIGHKDLGSIDAVLIGIGPGSQYFQAYREAVLP